ncbi:hypothetical protein IW262DRAFT_1295971 [Armillaria fumosa]|nr:hypothetical protein IW262DRAFT_1295971 [Armillaria fumosa]
MARRQLWIEEIYCVLDAGHHGIDECGKEELGDILCVESFIPRLFGVKCTVFGATGRIVNRTINALSTMRPDCSPIRMLRPISLHVVLLMKDGRTSFAVKRHFVEEGDLSRLEIFDDAMSSFLNSNLCLKTQPLQDIANWDFILDCSEYQKHVQRKEYTRPERMIVYPVYFKLPFVWVNEDAALKGSSRQRSSNPISHGKFLGTTRPTHYSRFYTIQSALILSRLLQENWMAYFWNPLESNPVNIYFSTALIIVGSSPTFSATSMLGRHKWPPSKHRFICMEIIIFSYHDIRTIHRRLFYITRMNVAGTDKTPDFLLIGLRMGHDFLDELQEAEYVRTSLKAVNDEDRLLSWAENFLDRKSQVAHIELSHSTFEESQDDRHRFGYR